MSTITFRVSKEEKEFLEKISDFNQSSLSDFVRTKSLEAAEDLMDIKTYVRLKEQHDEDDQSISHDQMKKELGF